MGQRSASRFIAATALPSRPVCNRAKKPAVPPSKGTRARRSRLNSTPESNASFNDDKPFPTRRRLRPSSPYKRGCDVPGTNCSSSDTVNWSDLVAAADGLCNVQSVLLANRHDRRQHRCQPLNSFSVMPRTAPLCFVRCLRCWLAMQRASPPAVTSEGSTRPGSTSRARTHGSTTRPAATNRGATGRHQPPKTPLFGMA
jgi:hypothetical protein